MEELYTYSGRDSTESNHYYWLNNGNIDKTYYSHGVTRAYHTNSTFYVSI